MKKNQTSKGRRSSQHGKQSRSAGNQNQKMQTDEQLSKQSGSRRGNQSDQDQL